MEHRRQLHRTQLWAGKRPICAGSETDRGRGNAHVCNPAEWERRVLVCVCASVSGARVCVCVCVRAWACGWVCVCGLCAHVRARMCGCGCVCACVGQPPRLRLAKHIEARPHTLKYARTHTQTIGAPTLPANSTYPLSPKTKTQSFKSLLATTLRAFFSLADVCCAGRTYTHTQTHAHTHTHTHTNTHTRRHTHTLAHTHNRGSNSAGQLNVPPLPTNEDTVIQVSAGYNTTCILLSSGRVLCWADLHTHTHTQTHTHKNSHTNTHTQTHTHTYTTLSQGLQLCRPTQRTPSPHKRRHCPSSLCGLQHLVPPSL